MITRKRTCRELRAHNVYLRLRLKEAEAALSALSERCQSEPQQSEPDLTRQKLAEEALKQGEERYRLLADTMLQGVVHQDADGRIIAMNPAAERILGKTRGEYLGRSTLYEEHHCIRENGETFPERDHPAMLALRSGLPVRGVIMGVFNPKLRSHRWIGIDAVPVVRPGLTQPTEVYTVFGDITERRRLERAFEAVALQHRFARQCVFRIDPAMAGQMLARIFQPVAVVRQHIIERQPRLQLGALYHAGMIER